MLKYLTRKTNTIAFIPEIDGLRFFAILTVVIFHMNTALSDSMHFDWKAYYGLNNPMEFGWWLVRLDLGVKVFFAISGFILSLPFLKYYILGEKKIELTSYFYRRLLRLEPPFIISLTVFFIMQLLLLKVNIIEYSKHYLANLIYSHGLIYGHNSPINPVTWSLETEAQFYIFIPSFLFILFIFKKQLIPFFILGLTFLVGLFLRKYIFEHSLLHFTSSILVYLTNFITGIFFAWFFIVIPDFFKKKTILFDAFGMISIFSMFLFYKPQINILNNTMFNLSIFIFIIAVFKGNLFNWLFTRKLVYIIGGMCYSIYLIHFGLFYFLAQKIHSLMPGTNYGTQLISFSMFSIILLAFFSIAFFLLIEKPCMDKNWPNQLKSFLRKK